jgi:chromatin segregation and condensation protein Rec8/ScpA/Scc1 (kleisin family)
MLSRIVDGALVRVPPPAPKKPETRVFKTISIAEVLDTLHERIQKALSVNFDDIIVHAPEGGEKEKKVYVIVSFLGMLELVRRGFVDAIQEEGFKTIKLSAQGTSESTPNYEE